jgi:signal transduction histidine kinase
MSDILTSARHLLQLINDILDLSKVEAGRMEFRPESSRIQTLVFEVRDVIRPMAEKKNLRLVADVPDDLFANLDPGRFKQVLYNYLSNAVKFTSDGGSVTVRIAREEDSRFRLEVETRGWGSRRKGSLFQEFSRVPRP